jgi:hypothetical protein
MVFRMCPFGNKVSTSLLLFHFVILFMSLHFSRLPTANAHSFVLYNKYTLFARTHTTDILYVLYVLYMYNK